MKVIHMSSIKNALHKILVVIKNGLNLPVRYGEEFFSETWFQKWEVLKYVLYELIHDYPEWKNILDFGCGPGIMIDFMNNKGYNYTGCDYSLEAYLLYKRRFGKNDSHYLRNLENIIMEYDLLLAFDVFEHMTDKEIHILLKKVQKIPEVIINVNRYRSIPGHVNIKSDKKWVLFFKKEGYVYNSVKTERIRNKYILMRPERSDLWNENIFIFSRETT